MIFFPVSCFRVFIINNFFDVSIKNKYVYEFPFSRRVGVVSYYFFFFVCGSFAVMVVVMVMVIMVVVVLSDKLYLGLCRYFFFFFFKKDFIPQMNYAFKNHPNDKYYFIVSVNKRIIIEEEVSKYKFPCFREPNENLIIK